MEAKKIARINELAKLKKQRPLTAEEAAEQQALRQEYLEEWRRGALATLDNTYVVEPDGTKTKLGKKE